MIMNRILVLGAGFVSKPLVRELLTHSQFRVTVADINLSAAQEVTSGHPNAEAVCLNLNNNRKELKKYISHTDLVISIVPKEYHPEIAVCCVELGKPMITTSYVDKRIKSLHKKALKAEVLLLNEMGLDPGIDHMEASRIIQEAARKGGQVEEFISYCGGLPSPESVDNPLKYKFSWSPRGVLQACKRPVAYLSKDKAVRVSAEDLFKNPEIVSVGKLGEFEGYPNGNSLPYGELYGTEKVKTLIRGTLRYKGWCKNIHALKEAGFFNEKRTEIEGKNYLEYTACLLGIKGEKIKIRERLEEKLKKEKKLFLLPILEWLGFLGKKPLPKKTISPLELLSFQMQKKMQYGKGERDMIVLQHTVDITYPGQRKERVVSSMIVYGEPDGDSAMARTVGLPAAIGAKLILNKKIPLTGIQIPVHPSIYQPVLSELKKRGIFFTEERKTLS